MGKFVKGDIVVIPFPFSDLSASKNRPALVLADLSGNDVILCQITSQHKKDTLAITLTPSDLKSGALIKLFTFVQIRFLLRMKVLFSAKLQL